MPKRPRPIRIDGDVAYVTLTKGYEAVIDAADVPLVAGRNWAARVNFRADGSVRAVYAVRSEYDPRQHNVWMHRQIVAATDGLEVDHHDGNGLNNRRANLRLVTPTQNQCNQRLRINNTSGVKGVSWNPRREKWEAQIRFGGKSFHLGRHSTREAAAAAYADASRSLHGNFGRVA